MRQNYKRILCICLVLINAFLFCSFDSENGITDKFGNEAVYKCVKLDEIFKTYNNYPDLAKSLYDEEYCCILAHVDSKRDKTLYLAALGEAVNSPITCNSYDSNVLSQIDGVEAGDNVLVYCKVDVGTLFSNSLSIKNIMAVYKTDAADVKTGSYALIDGASYTGSEQRILGNKIQYYIPKEWEILEHPLPLVDNKYILEGYYYRVNEKPENYKMDAEGIYIFYLENNKFVKDIKMFGETKKIEQAVVKNIIGDDSAKISSKKTTYGKKYDYYVSSFYDQNEKLHRIEFVFMPLSDNKGMCVMMYTFTKSDCVDDMLLFMRTIDEIN